MKFILIVLIAFVIYSSAKPHPGYGRPSYGGGPGFGGNDFGGGGGGNQWNQQASSFQQSQSSSFQNSQSGGFNQGGGGWGR